MSRLYRWFLAISLVGVAALPLGYLAWGVTQIGDRPIGVSHYYEYLAQGFLNGHTYLSIEPDPYLATLPNPYNPGYTEGHRQGDLSYFHHKYYLYFGPTPVLLFLLPVRLLSGVMPSQWMAAPFFGSLGFLALARLVIEMRTAFFPKVSNLRLAAIVVALFHATWLPVMMGRAAVWEVAIISEVACFWWAVYGLWRYARSGRIRWAGFSAAMVVFATASRPTILPASGMLVLALAWVRPAGDRARWRAWSVPLLILVVGGLGLAAYNFVRFGNPLNFGNKYQLLGDYVQNRPYFTFQYFRYTASLYLFEPPIFSPYFPYLYGSKPPIPPVGYFGTDEMHGAFVAVPILVFAALGLRFGWASRNRPSFGPLTLVLAASVFAGLFLCFVLFMFPGTCIRYTCELLAGWLPAIGVGGLVLLDPETKISPALRGGLRLAAGLMTLWTVGYVWMAAVACYDIAVDSTPRRYTTWARVLGGPSGWVGRAEHLRYGGAFLDVAFDPYTGPTQDVLMTGEERRFRTVFLVKRIDAKHVQFEFGCSIANIYGSLLTSAVIECPDNHLQVVVDAPWFYPPAHDPYWDRFPGEAGYLRRHQYVIRVGDKIVNLMSTGNSLSVQLQPVYARAKGPDNPDGWLTDVHWELPRL